jgi:alpha-amylase
VPFVNNHDTFRPKFDKDGNYIGWNTGSELAPHIDPFDPRLSLSYAVAFALDGSPQVFFEDLFNVGNSNRWSHDPKNTNELPVRTDIENIIWCHQNLHFKDGAYKVKYQSQDHLVIERSTKALIGVNDNWNTWQKNWVQSDFAQGTVLQDYSGANGIATATVGANGWVEINTPPCDGSANQGRRGYSIWAPQGIGNNKNLGERKTTQEWELANDLGDSHSNSLQQGGALPSNSLDERYVGRIYVESGKAVDYELFPEDGNQELEILLYDNTTLLDSKKGKGVVSGYYFPNYKGWLSVKVRNGDINNTAQKAWVKLTYTAPKSLAPKSYKLTNTLVNNSGSSSDELKIMSYNLLNFPSGYNYCFNNNVTKNRHDTLKKILNYINPDILMVNELGSEKGANLVLDSALNVDGITKYDRADFEYNTASGGKLHQNLLFFNADKLTLEKQEVIKSTIRDLNSYFLYHNDIVNGDTVFFNVIIAHLKASKDSLAETIRSSQINDLKKYLSKVPAKYNKIFGGDLNLYDGAEPAFQKIISGKDKYFDPVNQIGKWNNNKAYAEYHTQSTRAYGDIVRDCGVTGGGDDRFDFIMHDEKIENALGRVSYVQGSYDVIGNDGDNFNEPLYHAGNKSETKEIRDALYYMSDHLPVVCSYRIEYPNPCDGSLAVDKVYSINESNSNNDGELAVSVSGGKAPYIVDWVSNQTDTLNPFAFVSQNFESTQTNGWNFLVFPNTYNSNGGSVVNGDYDVWDTINEFTYDIDSKQGLSFWGMQDLDNNNGGISDYHTMTFDAVDVSGLVGGQIKFDYFTKDYDAGDEIEYLVEFNNGNSWDSVGVKLEKKSNMWKTVIVNIPDSVNYVRLRLQAKQNGKSDYAAFDNIRIEENSSVISGLSAGDYLVSVKDSNNCKIDTIFTIYSGTSSVNVLPSDSTNNDSTIVNSNTGNNGSNNQNTGSNTNAIDNLMITQLVSPVSNCGLTNSEAVTVIVNNHGATDISSFDISYILNGNTVTETVNIGITAGKSITYTFNTKADLSSPFEYQITTNIVGSKNAQASNVSLIENSGSLSVDLGVDKKVCQAGLELDATTVGATYNWSSGESTAKITPQASGIYSVTVTKNGCTATDEVNVDFLANIQVTETIVDASCGFSDGKVALSGNNLSYKWNNGNSTNEISNISAGDYDVVITDLTSGCSETKTFTVNASGMNFNFVKDTVEVCADNSTFVDAGFGYTTYAWSTGETTQKATFTQSGNYTVTVSLGQGCTATDEIYVNVNCSSVKEPIDSTDNVITSVNSDNIQNKAIVFPNPSNGNFNIKGENIEMVEVYNLNGQLVQSVHSNNQKITSPITLEYLNKFHRIPFKQWFEEKVTELQ